MQVGNNRVEVGVGTKTEYKAVTIRASVKSIEEIVAIAGARRISVAETIRRALAHYVEEERLDPEFQRRLEAHVERDRAILARLTNAEIEAGIDAGIIQSPGAKSGTVPIDQSLVARERTRG